MDHHQLRKAREAYAYVPARLVRSNGTGDLSPWGSLQLSRIVPPTNWHSEPSERAKHSSAKLDEFHCRLLSSNDAEDLKHALLSIVFWGFASGKDGKIREERAAERANWHVVGRKGSQAQDADEILRFMISAREALAKSQIEKALIAITSIKYLGLAFGSKVLAFMNPSIAGVYDNIISNHLASHPSPELKAMGGGVDTTRKAHQAALYSKWCNWCAAKAATLNEAKVTWRDWDGAEHRWRAVDVERAFFAFAERRTNG